jgi:hypothetical protein
MSLRFRPRLNALEARDVPASFSFQLPDGSTSSAQFSTPAGVDPSELWQEIELTDLTLSYGGVEYTVAPVPFAYYASGVLVGVVANAFSATDQIDLSLGTAAVTPLGTTDTEYGSIAYDGADTQSTFTFPDGTTGSISYAIPWESVDPDLATQSVALTAFNLNIAGRNFAYGSASYTTAPMLQFEYGELKSVTFALDTSATQGFAYTSFSGAVDANGNNIVEAVKAGIGPLQPVLLRAAQAQAVFNFNTGATDTSNTVLPTGTRIRIQVKAGDYTYDYDATTVAGETVGDVAAQVYENMKTAGWNVSLLPSGRGIVVNGKLIDQGKVNVKVEQAGINYSTVAQPVGPKTAGGVQLLILDNGTWKPKP